MFEFYFPPEECREGMAHVTRLSHSCDNPNWHFALHVHQEDLELLYIAGGRASLMVGTRQVQVEAGDILLVKPGTSHSTTSDPNAPSDIWSVSLSHVPEEMLAGFSAVPWAKAGEHTAFLQAAVRQLQIFSRQLVPATQLTCDYIGNSLLTLYSHLIVREEKESGSGTDDLSHRVLVYLDQNYSQHIDLKHLERQFFTSSGHISREFRKAYHISPINYLIDKRLSQAKWLLINTNDPIQDVSQAVGYDNVYYFSKLFLEKVGVNPFDYRQTFFQA